MLTRKRITLPLLLSLYLPACGPSDDDTTADASPTPYETTPTATPTPVAGPQILDMTLAPNPAVEDDTANPVTAEFTITSSDPSVTYSVDWGEQTTSLVAASDDDARTYDPAAAPVTVTHIYTASGTYNVCLTARDNQGERTECRGVEVLRNYAPNLRTSAIPESAVGTYTTTVAIDVSDDHTPAESLTCVYRVNGGSDNHCSIA